MAENHRPSPIFRRWPPPLAITAIFLSFHLQFSQAQQQYVDNKQLNCDVNYTTALGFVCSNATTTNGRPTPFPSSCSSYVTFRSTPIYNSPATISDLLDADPTQIARLNKISGVTRTVPTDTLIVIPVNCSCSSTAGGHYYQHNVTYSLKFTGETYFSVANNTYQGLTTCQSMIAQNPNNYLELVEKMKIKVPLRCACPSPNQTAQGYNYLLSYLINWGDSVNKIAGKFSSSGAVEHSILEANLLSESALIFPFTPLLVPLKTEPTKIDLTISPPPPPAPPTLTTNINPVSPDDKSSSRKWVYVGVGIGVALLFLLSLLGCLVWFLWLRTRPQKKADQATPVKPNMYGDYHKPFERKNDSSSWSISSEGVRYAVGSLTYYKFHELEEATGFFGEANRIKGSVYRGFFKGDSAAVKIMNGDVSNEINILKQINHSNIIRLSGYCVHQGNTYLVYEYAENGSVSDLLHEPYLLKKDELVSASTAVLRWNQRVQIAYDVADALNYLHNYTNPPCIHKNLTTSNVLLDGNYRAKIANFGLARTMENDMQLTRRVVGNHGCMAPEYIENGLITPKLDVYAFGVIILELLSGREAVQHKDVEKGEEDQLLSAAVAEILGGENVREKLRDFIDPGLRNQYPLDLAYSMAQLAKCCVADDLDSRPNIAEIFVNLSKIHSSSLDWDPSDEFESSRSMSTGR